ncbi:MAG: GNAT family N-acetyltransferase [Mycobacterium sp.]|uniref:N-acetylglutamate synthase, CG3035 family n=1 Tax=Mycobacterium sp. TaxID=1785 RepID=UPI003CC6A078
MLSWPDLRTRVAVRYRRPEGSVPPLTDAIGHLLQIEPSVRIRMKAGAVVEIAVADVVAVRPLTDTPIRTSQIRALEHAAALAHPGIEHSWLNGWFLRAGRGGSMTSNSAVPLDVSASLTTIPTIVDWYARRGLPPRLALPDRLLRVPGAAEQSHRLLVRDIEAVGQDPSIELGSRPTNTWLQEAGNGPLVDEATAVVGGEVIFGTYLAVAAARAAVTDAPDRTRWVGVSALRLTGAGRSLEAAHKLMKALLNWGAEQGAARAYVRISEGEVTLGRIAESLGFTLHHRGCYVVAGHS